MVRISCYSNKRDNNPKILEYQSFHAFLDDIKEYEFRANKDGPLFSPGEIDAGKERGNENTLWVHFGMLDLDDVTDEDLEIVLNRLQGLSCGIYYTWRHPEAQKRGLHRCRILVELSEPVRGDEWPDFWPRLVTRFGSQRDDSCRDASRMYYAPSLPVGEDKYAIFEIQEGAALDVQEVWKDPLPEGFQKKERRRPRVPGGGDPTAVIPPAVRTWGRRFLQSKQDLIRSVPPPPHPIYPDLNRAAFELGRLTPHIIDTDEAAVGLFEACTQRCPDEDRWPHYEEIIEKGIEDGQANAWYPAASFALSDTGNVKRFAASQADEMHYVSTWRKWISWDGHRWSLDKATGEVHRRVSNTLLSIHQEADECRDEKHAKFIRKWAKTCESRDRRNACLDHARWEEGVEIQHQILDSDPWQLNVANGTVDLRTGILSAHDPDDLLTKISPIIYNPKATCPAWEKFLLECMDGQKDMVSYLQRVVGYALTGSVREHCLFFLYGDGANGKSTFINTVLHLLGDYGVVGAPDLLSERARGVSRHPTEQAILAGARLCSCQEIEQGKAWAEIVVKQLTGGDPVSTRRMHEDFWTFLPTHKFFISGNHKPPVRGTDLGIWRRFRLIPFTVSFADRADKNLGATLLGEAEGILAWAVQGCLSWQRVGLAEPKAVIDANQEYRSEQDLVGNFIADCCDTDGEARAQSAQLQAAFKQYQMNEGFTHTMNPRRFSSELKRMGFEMKRSNGVNWWHGLQIRRQKLEKNAEKPN